MVAMMMLTYLLIIALAAICKYSINNKGMLSIQSNFQVTVILFIIVFLIYIAIFSFVWYKGSQERERLIIQIV